MKIPTEKLLFIPAIIIMGYCWLYFSPNITVCITYNIAGIPCPSCGTTRAINLLLDGHIIDSIYYNPFGIIVFSIMLILPFIILIDYKIIFNFKIHPKLLSIILIIVLINWIWNIYKFI